jgi:hypothetical protein
MKNKIWIAAIAALVACKRDPLPVVPNDGSGDTVFITLVRDRDYRVTEKSFKGYQVARYLNGLMMGVCNNEDCVRQITAAENVAKKGWYLINGSDTTKLNPQKYIVPKDAPDSLTFYMYNSFSLIFDYGGKGTNDSIVYFGLSPMVIMPQLPENIPAAANFDFDGWNINNNGMRYNNTPITLPSALYARWIPTHRITFNTRGGSSIPEIRVRENSRIPRPLLPPTHSTNPQMLFWGWYMDDACEAIWNFSRTIDTAMTLYARWYNSFGNEDVLTPGINILKEDLPGYYTWTKDGEESRTHYNPCPAGWEVPDSAKLHFILQHASNATWGVLPSAWSSTYMDSLAQMPYKHRAFSGNEPRPVITLAPVRCIKYTP